MTLPTNPTALLTECEAALTVLRAKYDAATPGRWKLVGLDLVPTLEYHAATLQRIRESLLDDKAIDAHHRAVWLGTNHLFTREELARHDAALVQLGDLWRLLCGEGA